MILELHCNANLMGNLLEAVCIVGNLVLRLIQLYRLLELAKRMLTRLRSKLMNKLG